VSQAKSKQKGRDITTAVNDLCLWFPDTECVMSHGSPDFRVAGKTFATYVINHHGDGHLALWLKMPAGAQSLYVDAEPEYFYVPPYVGPKGWLGVDLDQGLDWGRIAELVRQAYIDAAPKSLTATLPPGPDLEPPTLTIDPEEFDPLVASHRTRLLAQIRALCLALPETSEDRQFGNPCFRAGKKNFCTVYMSDSRLQLSFWAGREAQASLTFDKRYQIPPYTGHNGWLNLDIEDGLMAGEAEVLIEQSYRHFALKRMLKALDAQQPIKRTESTRE
jgi:predicted DNA-binding protein (MmcQ/YjbR family)